MQVSGGLARSLGAAAMKTPLMRRLFNAALAAVLHDSLFKELKFKKKQIKKKHMVWFRLLRSQFSLIVPRAAFKTSLN